MILGLDVEGTEFSVSKASGSTSIKGTVGIGVVHVAGLELDLASIEGEGTSELNLRGAEEVLSDNTDGSGTVGTDVERSAVAAVSSVRLSNDESAGSAAVADIEEDLIRVVREAGLADHELGAASDEVASRGELNDTDGEGAVGGSVGVGEGETVGGKHGEDNLGLVHDGTAGLVGHGGTPVDGVGVSVVVEEDALNAVVVHAVDVGDDDEALIEVVHIEVVEGHGPGEGDPITEGESTVVVDGDEGGTEVLLHVAGAVELGTSGGDDEVGLGETGDAVVAVDLGEGLGGVGGDSESAGGILGDDGGHGVDHVVGTLVGETEVVLIESIDLGVGGTSGESGQLTEVDVDLDLVLGLDPLPGDGEGEEVARAHHDVGLVGETDEVVNLHGLGAGHELVLLTLNDDIAGIDLVDAEDTGGGGEVEPLVDAPDLDVLEKASLVVGLTVDGGAGAESDLALRVDGNDGSLFERNEVGPVGELVGEEAGLEVALRAGSPRKGTYLVAERETDD